MFLAVERTSVTNIVLIETIEIPLGLFLAWLLYRERSSWSAVIGALLALVGVTTTLWLEMGQPSEMMQQGQMRGGIGRGEIYAATGTFLLVLGAELGRKQLRTIPLGVFSVFRNFVGLDYLPYRRAHYARTGTLYGSFQTRALGLDGVVRERHCGWRSTLLVFGD